MVQWGLHHTPSDFFSVFFLLMCVQERVRNASYSRDNVKMQHLDQPEEQSGHRDHARDKLRHRVRQMLWDSPTEESRIHNVKGRTHHPPFILFLNSSVLFPHLLH